MMNIFTRTPHFTVLFLTILVLDVYVKLSLPEFPYRYISKPMVMLLLIIYYWLNHREVKRKKFIYVILGMISFLIGDLLLIMHLRTSFLIGGMVLFMIGKLFYGLKFSHTSDFDLKRLIPFLLVIFAFMAVLFSFIYDKLDNLFVPVLFYFFVSLLTLQIAFLRKEVVNFKSYMLVLFGLELWVVGESVMALKMFYGDIPFQDILTMMFYGISQYLIVIGLVWEHDDNTSITDSSKV